MVCGRAKEEQFMTYPRLVLIVSAGLLLPAVMFLPPSEARRSGEDNDSAKQSAATEAGSQRVLQNSGSAAQKSAAKILTPYVSQAVAFAETPPLRDLKAVRLSTEEMRAQEEAREAREKNEENTISVKRPLDPGMTMPFVDPTLKTLKEKTFRTAAVTNPIQSFDGPDMDGGVALFGGRFAPPDSNAAVGPNHIIAITNGGFMIFNKTGTVLVPQTRISALLTGIPNAADDDGDPIALYDALADRWLLSQFNFRFDFNNSMHEHIAISKTGDPTGGYFVYDFALTPGRFGDYPHFGVWPDGYYMSTNDFNPPGTTLLGAGFYAFERAAMLAGNPAAKLIAFNSGATEGGLLPANFQGFTPPPNGTPNLFIEFDGDEFGAVTDLIRVFEFRPDFNTPGSSTLTQLPDIATAAFDARSPSGRQDIAQPAPATSGDSVDGIADRLMHPLNFRVLPGGIQSYVLNFTVNVSGVNPTTPATYQAGVRWMELRRNSGTGAVTINQQATYAPGAGNPTGRDLWMGSIAQDGEGNIALAANASNSTATPTLLAPTAIYTGRLASDPINTLPQSEVDTLATVTKGVQTGTGNRWGDYSSMFVDPGDDCTFWGAFEYVDAPAGGFDWNTRIFSFKVNPTCVTPPKGSFTGTITDCVSGLPVQNAVVESTDPTGFLRTTTASGTYSIDNAAPGEYDVRVSKFGYATNAGVITVTNGETATLNLCIQPIPVMNAATATIVSESCSPANGAIDPGETVTVSLCVQNIGAADTTNLVGTLQATNGVTNPSGSLNYGALTAGGGAVCRDFTFTADATCGGVITASLQLQDGPTDLGTLSYSFDVGALGVPLTTNYSSGNIAVPITDNSTVDIPINVSETGVVNDVNVSVRLNHTFDADLVISLVHPDGTVVSLSMNRGSNGDNYGFGTNNCSGSHTVFDDSAATAVSAGTAPFAGSFRPELPLSALNGKRTNGTWKLRVSDTGTQDTGTIGCARLEINRLQFICCGVAGTPNIFTAGTTIASESCPAANGVVDPGETVSVSFCLQNLGTGDTSDLVATLQATGGVASPGAPQSYGVLLKGGPTVCRTFTFTANGACGDALTASLQLQDGAINLGTVTNNFTLGTSVSTTSTFSNITAITVPGSGSAAGPAAPYPSNIAVSGLTDTVTKVTVTLTNIGHTFPDDLDLLLVGPGGEKLLLMSDTGGGTDIANVNLTFDDSAPSSMPDSTVLTSGTFRPTNINSGDVLASPAPPGPYADPQLLSIFNGLNPNGTWSLYVADDASGDVGSIAGGWSLNITTSAPVCCAQACTLSCPANITVSNDPNQCGAVVNYPGPATLGSCGTVVCSPASGSLFPTGTTTVTCTSTAGPSCSFTVTVNDTQAPDITCPANIRQSADPGMNGAVVNYSSPTATDNCPSVITQCSPASGSIFPLGTTAVTCTATDAAANTASCNFSVTIDRPPAWSTVGANGAIDEDSLAIAAVDNFTLGFAGSHTGTINVRYNIIAVRGIANLCPATNSTVTVRFQDNDGSGPSSQVLFEIHSSNVAIGGNTVIYTFDSNDAGTGADGAFHTFSETVPGLDFDFANNIYWIEARIRRTNSSLLTNLAAIQIYESSGTPCP